MRSKTANWFICKIRYEKTQEDGLQKKVTESYVVDAVSFGEAESRIIEEMQAYISGEFEVIDISRAAFKEIFFSDEETADRWYNAKLEFITIDEKVMGGTMIDYVTAKIEETKLMDVFEYAKKEQAENAEESE